MDGNGRIARFLMNVMLVSGGYNWVIVSVAERDKYTSALAVADTEHNLVTFTKLITDLLEKNR